MLATERKQFLVFTDVKAKLADDKMGAGGDLGEEFGVLEDLLSLGNLKGRDDAAGQEIHGGQGHHPSWCLLFQGQGLVQSMNKGEELGRVEVKDRHGLAVETVTGKVTTQDQQVEQAVAMAFKELAFSHVPVLVLEREVDQGLKAHGLDVNP